jgi:hypothetical protein
MDKLLCLALMRWFLIDSIFTCRRVERTCDDSFIGNALPVLERSAVSSLLLKHHPRGNGRAFTGLLSTTEYRNDAKEMKV